MATLTKNSLNSLTLRDLKIVSELPHVQSLRKLSREMQIEAQHMSKIIKTIESKIDLQLLNRSVKGISVTPEGVRCAQMCKQIIDAAVLAQESFEQTPQNKPQVLALASRVFLNSILSGVYARLTQNQFSNSRIRLVDGSSERKEEWAQRGLVDLIVSIDKLTLSKSWMSQHVGEIEWAFYARKQHPHASTQMTVTELMQNKILIHAYVSDKRLIESDQVMGLKIRSRSQGMSVETATSAISAILNSNQIALLPTLLVSQFKLVDELTHIHLQGHERIRQKVYLSCHVDRVSQKFFKELALNITQTLAG